MEVHGFLPVAPTPAQNHQTKLIIRDETIKIISGYLLALWAAAFDWYFPFVSGALPSVSIVALHFSNILYNRRTISVLCLCSDAHPARSRNTDRCSLAATCPALWCDRLYWNDVDVQLLYYINYYLFLGRNNIIETHSYYDCPFSGDPSPKPFRRRWEETAHF